jgi:hypothetical protein
LALSGIEVYSQELRKVIRKFGRVFGHAVTVIPGIPVFLDGTDDTAVARNLVEMGLWLSKISTLSRKKFEILVEIVSKENPPIPGDRRKVTLPVGLYDHASTIWESPGGICRNGPRVVNVITTPRN